MKIYSTDKKIAKRPRIKATVPQYTTTVEYRIKKAFAELNKGLSKWDIICAEVKRMETQNK